MWSVGVVIMSPAFDLGSGIFQADKDMLIEALVPELAVEALDIGILGRLPWLNKAEFDVVRIGPGIKGFTDKFRAVVHGDDIRQTPS